MAKNPKKKIVNFWISDTFKEDLAAAAKEEGYNISEFVKVSIYHYMKYVGERRQERSKAKLLEEKEGIDGNSGSDGQEE